MHYVEIDQEKRCDTTEACSMNENAIPMSVFVFELLQFDFFFFLFKIALVIPDRQPPKERHLTLSVLKGH